MRNAGHTLISTRIGFKIHPGAPAPRHCFHAKTTLFPCVGADTAMRTDDHIALPASSHSSRLIQRSPLTVRSLRPLVQHLQPFQFAQRGFRAYRRASTSARVALLVHVIVEERLRRAGGGRPLLTFGMRKVFVEERGGLAERLDVSISASASVSGRPAG